MTNTRDPDGLSVSISIHDRALMVLAKVTTKQGADKLIAILNALKNQTENPETELLEAPVDKTEEAP